jgi:NAD(P)-dependent dehydrogenase (short-subunit alcohol dehydrogenase family)
MSKVVIVTGASGLLGSVIAIRFGAEGYNVVATYFRSRQRADEVVAQINKGPGQAFAHEVDIRKYEQVKKLVDETLTRWSRVDVMACVAGQALGRLRGIREDKPLIEHTEEDWDLVMDTNLKGTFHCINPGYIPRRGTPDENIERYRRQAVLHQVPTPDEVAKFYVYLSDTSQISGQILNVNN